MENAERILTVLVNNNAIAGNRIVVREIILKGEFSKEDFEAADAYLLQQGYVDGTLGGEEGTRSLTGGGIEFYERLEATRPKEDSTIEPPTIFAKLAGLYKTVSGLLAKEGRYYDPAATLELFKHYDNLYETLRSLLPTLYSDLPKRDIPKSSGTTDFEGRGYITKSSLEQLKRDLEYIFEVRSHSRIGKIVAEEHPRRIFISHGSSQDWREVQDFIEKVLRIDTLELAQQPNMGRTVLQKLHEESNKCSFAVIIMTGDDDFGTGSPRARENVMHEIGFFQGKYGLSNICVLYEEGTNIPSNIHGLVYIPFPKGLVKATFGALTQELGIVFPE